VAQAQARLAGGGRGVRFPREFLAHALSFASECDEVIYEGGGEEENGLILFIRMDCMSKVVKLLAFILRSSVETPRASTFPPIFLLYYFLNSSRITVGRENLSNLQTLTN